MIRIEIDATNAAQAIARLDDRTLARAIADGVDTDLLQPALRNAPAARPQKQPFVSDKQRKAFFAKLRSGAIAVPYVRTGRATNIGNWPRQDAPDGLSRTGEFPYAELLRGPKQARYHAGNWPTVEQMAGEVEGKAETPATAALLDVLEQLGLT